MTQPSFAEELASYGPRAGAAGCSLAESEAYCRRLARSHYENFTVASWLLPRSLRKHFYHVYAYCRWADDLADEVDSADQSLQLLDWWESQLDDCYRGVAHHPVFVALRQTIEEFEIPRQPLADLLVAFRQDQVVTRYETFDDLLGYCRNSANPVGRLVLYPARCHDERRAQLSDAVCTGLQLANFCQDVAADWDRGRVYIPQAELRSAGYSEPMFHCREYNAQFRQLMQMQVDRAAALLRSGYPLVPLMPKMLRVDMALFIEGGLGILEAIRRADYDVWHARPKLSKAAQMRLLARCWWKSRRGSFAIGEACA